MKRVVAAVLNGVSVSTTCIQILNSANIDVQKSGMRSSTDPRHKVFWKLSEYLLDHTFISHFEAAALLGGFYDEMRKSNIFAYHRNTKTITFQSKAHENIVRQDRLNIQKCRKKLV